VHTDAVPEPELIAALQALVAEIDRHETAVSELRPERRALVVKLRNAGWSLERIGREVGRTKQTITKWLR